LKLARQDLSLEIDDAIGPLIVVAQARWRPDPPNTSESLFTRMSEASEQTNSTANGNTISDRRQ
jgi:hypothetical protein